ncbi:hypothetical protein H0H92_005347, partial [Tricholoma furcatifolium]
STPGMSIPPVMAPALLTTLQFDVVMLDDSQPRDKVIARPYKCPYALCGRAFSRLEHQANSSHTHSHWRKTFRLHFSLLIHGNHTDANISASSGTTKKTARKATKARTQSLSSPIVPIDSEEGLVDGYDDEDDIYDREERSLRAKKKARSRANSDDEGESYARPTSMMSSDTPLSRRTQSSNALSQPQRYAYPTPSAFTTLSSVAMDELYALERQEALRRAEYEARHAEALRRAEYQARVSNTTHGWTRLSKSATTSPIMSAPEPLAPERGTFGLSNERSGFVHQDELHRGAGSGHGHDPYEKESEMALKARRRLSGPAFSMTAAHPPYEPVPHNEGTLTTSRSSGQLLSGTQHGPAWNQPYSYSRGGAHRRTSSAGVPYDESPSPMSSDSESPPLHIKTLHPSHRAPVPAHSPTTFPSSRAAPGEFSFTPSTSPFLGPLRTLNIHSAQPSRAPSPVLLPPPHLNLDSSHSPKQRSAGAVTNSPPHSWGKPRNGGIMHYPTSASGTSSPGVSFVRGTASTSSSRAPSPPLWPGSRPSTGVDHHHHHHGVHAGHYHHHLPSAHHAHHHLAHSVRAAFGMTPIMHPHGHGAPLSPPPSAGFAVSQPHSGVSTPLSGARVGPLSMPGSRSSSPPITLAPMKIAGVGSGVAKDVVKEEEGEEETVVAEREKVELPGFSAFEAATMGTAGRF